VKYADYLRSVGKELKPPVVQRGAGVAVKRAAVKPTRDHAVHGRVSLAVAASDVVRLVCLPPLNRLLACTRLCSSVLAVDLVIVWECMAV
jgi:hypothetical protein